MPTTNTTTYGDINQRTAAWAATEIARTGQAEIRMHSTAILCRP